jgi:hypothetical protein
MDKNTKKAIEEMQGTTNTTKPKPVTVNKSQETKTETNQILLGLNKKVTIKPWTGKTKKKFKNLFKYVESPEDIDFDEIVQLLLYSNIKENVYLNEGEQQLLLAEIKKISISDDISNEIECQSCGKITKIHKKLDDVISYKKNKLPSKFKDIDFIDIENKETLISKVKEITESEDYDGVTTPTDIEFAMHIKLPDTDTDTDTNKINVNTVIEYLDNLPINELSELVQSINEVLPSCEYTTSFKCKYCSKDQEANLDITQEIFEELLK